MHLHSIRLVAAVALFACVEASSLKSQPCTTSPTTSDQDHDHAGASTTADVPGLDAYTAVNREVVAPIKALRVKIEAATKKLYDCDKIVQHTEIGIGDGVESPKRTLVNGLYSNKPQKDIEPRFVNPDYDNLKSRKLSQH